MISDAVDKAAGIVELDKALEQTAAWIVTPEITINFEVYWRLRVLPSHLTF